MSWCTTYSIVPPIQYCWEPNGEDPNAGSGSGMGITFDDVGCGATAIFSIRTACGTAAVTTGSCVNQCGP